MRRRQQRERAFELVSAGAPLREAADALGIAWWLRKLPPQAFVAPLPALSDRSRLRLSHRRPHPARSPARADLAGARGHAHEACGPHYALWLARQDDLIATADEFFMLMAAWAWFSAHQGHLGHRLLRKPWHNEMSFKRAREELASWRQRLRLIECLGHGIETPWLSDGAAAGTISSPCARSTTSSRKARRWTTVSTNTPTSCAPALTAVFSIRKDARSVACVEIGLHEAEVTMPTVVQLRAARNRRAPPEVWQATYAWLGSQRLEPLAPERHTPKPRSAWRRGGSCGAPIWHSWPARRTSRRSGVS